MPPVIPSRSRSKGTMMPLPQTDLPLVREENVQSSSMKRRSLRKRQRRRSRSIQTAAGIVLFCAALLLVISSDRDIPIFLDSSSASRYLSHTSSSNGSNEGYRPRDYSKIRRILKEKDENSEEEKEDKTQEKDEELTNDLVGDWREDLDLEPDKLEHDLVLDSIIEQLYAVTSTAGIFLETEKSALLSTHRNMTHGHYAARGVHVPSYWELFAAAGWGFEGIDALQDERPQVYHQVMQISYPDKFSCTSYKDEAGNPDVHDIDVKCYENLLPLVDMIDAPTSLHIMTRDKRSIMDRFNFVHAGVKEKLDDDRIAEMKRKAEEMAAEQKRLAAEQLKKRKLEQAGAGAAAAAAASAAMASF